MTRIDVVRATIARLGARRYLEIGVRDGACFHAIDVPTKVAVDPAFTFRRPLAARVGTLLRRRDGVRYYPTTSDAFFAGPAERHAPFDVVFVDGLHTYEQTYRDIVNSLEMLAHGGAVLAHDCNPASEAAAAPTLEKAARTPGFVGEWNGDVYKAIVRVRTDASLTAAVLDCDQGIAVIRPGTPTARLDLTEAEIATLDYTAFDPDRVRLLDLRPPDDLDELLGLHSAGTGTA